MRPATIPKMGAKSNAPPDLFEALVKARRRGDAVALATVVGTRGSTPGKEAMRLLVWPDGRFLGTVGGGCVEADVVDAALQTIASETPQRLVFRLTESATGRTGLMCGGELEVFIEPLTVPPLYLFGAGHVSHALAPMAAEAGFRVTVVDDRAAFASEERFPSAARIVAAPSFGEAFPLLDISENAYCVVVTRGHAYDLECLDFALTSPARYVGLIGSQVKVRGILKRLAASGSLAGVDLARLHAPIGLDLGGGTHGEIAVSIMAELIATRRGRANLHSQKRIEPEAMRDLAARATLAGPVAESHAEGVPECPSA